jgi:tetratricopeptide (TPR) repeat protein
MKDSRRTRYTGRGQERAWWLLAAAVLFAVLWAVAQVLQWPVWARAVVGGLAAAAVLVVPELRARYKQDDALAALLRGAAAVSDERGRLPRVRDVPLAKLRVHESQVSTPYVQRDAQLEVAEAVGPGRAVLLVGHSMAGKTRLAAQVIQSDYPHQALLVASSGKALQALVAVNWNPAGVLVWLDDLERFLGEDGLTLGVLDTLTSGAAIVVGTIRVHSIDPYRPSNKQWPPEWDVLKAFTQIELKRGLSEAELGRVRTTVTDPKVLTAVRQYGLAEYLGAGPEALDNFTKGETTQPVGYALVRAAVDWRRTGLSRPIPRTVLAAVALIYLDERPEVCRTDQALDQGLEWATAKINETVALLRPDLADPANITFEAFEYLVDHLTLAGASIPDGMWQVSLEKAQPSEALNVGRVAMRSDKQPVAELALQKAAKAGDREAMAVLGALLVGRGESGEGEAWCRRGADAGQSDAMVLLGMLLAERGESGEAEHWWRKAADADQGDAILELGKLLERRGESGEEEDWWRKATTTDHILAGGQVDAMYNLGVLLDRRGALAEAEDWWRKAAAGGHTSAMFNLGLSFPSNRGGLVASSAARADMICAASAGSVASRASAPMCSRSTRMSPPSLSWPTVTNAGYGAG